MLGEQKLKFKMKQNILIINLCREKLHELEFVKPLAEIVKKEGQNFFTKKYKEVNQKDLDKADKIIISGTSLKDNDFSLRTNIKFFEWIKDIKKPILGICGGMQIIGLIISSGKAKLKRKTQIGFFEENFHKEFLGLIETCQVYHLHNYYLDFSRSNFDVFSYAEDIAQAVKHKEKDIFGVLFHPEVRQKGLIAEFLKISKI